MKNTGEIIKSLRKQRGITQEQLGKVIGVQKSAIAKYEHGDVVNLKRDSIQKIADYFGVRPSYILGMTEEPFDLSPEEIGLIVSYRSSSDEIQNAVKRILNM